MDIHLTQQKRDGQRRESQVPGDSLFRSTKTITVLFTTHGTVQSTGLYQRATFSHGCALLFVKLLYQQSSNVRGPHCSLGTVSGVRGPPRPRGRPRSPGPPPGPRGRRCLTLSSTPSRPGCGARQSNGRVGPPRPPRSPGAETPRVYVLRYRCPGGCALPARYRLSCMRGWTSAQERARPVGVHRLGRSCSSRATDRRH
jgi:hypothetical protein